MRDANEGEELNEGSKWEKLHKEVGRKCTHMWLVGWLVGWWVGTGKLGVLLCEGGDMMRWPLCQGDVLYYADWIGLILWEAAHMLSVSESQTDAQSTKASRPCWMPWKGVQYWQGFILGCNGVVQNMLQPHIAEWVWDWMHQLCGKKQCHMKRSGNVGRSSGHVVCMWWEAVPWAKKQHMWQEALTMWHTLIESNLHMLFHVIHS